MKPTFNKVGFFISLFKHLNDKKRSTVSVDLFFNN